MKDYRTDIDAANEMIEKMQEIIVMQQDDVRKAVETIQAQHDLIEKQRVIMKFDDMMIKFLMKKED